jgi:uncharacterized membrane protein
MHHAGKTRIVQQQSRTAEADRRMERLMGRLLQTGVFAAAGVVMIGGVLYLVYHGGEKAAFSRFQPRPLSVDHPAGLIRQLSHGGPSAVLDLGILILVATPICRVIFALISFAEERDRLFVAVSLLVLSMLLFGIFHGS